MIHKLFNTLFCETRRKGIRARGRSEPWITMRKAWILFAYIEGYSIGDIAWCTGLNKRQTKYLLEKAEELYSVNDHDITNYIKQYERQLAESCNADSKTNR